MDELKIIRYLLDEIEAEQEYNSYYDREREKAERTADKRNEGWYNYYKYMPAEIYRDKRYSIIKENAKMIRRLLLKFY